MWKPKRRSFKVHTDTEKDKQEFKQQVIWAIIVVAVILLAKMMRG